MLKILNTDQIKAWDAYTIEHEPIASIDLMERACKAFVQWFVEKFDASAHIGVVCGTGNNGGDGLGIARMLSDWGYPVRVWIVIGTATESDDFKMNKQRLPEKVELSEIKSTPSTDIFSACAIIIDGLFGSGLSRSAEGVYADVINCINDTGATTVSIDIPSGLFADKSTDGICVQSDYTLTFQAPKLAFLLPENESRVGEWTVVDIGLSKSYKKEITTSHFLVDKKEISRRFPRRRKFSHKGDFGNGLLVAGSLGKMGACVLASQAAMRSGIGLLTVHVPKAGYSIIQTSVAEAMVSVDIHDSYFSQIEKLKDYTAIGIGPGLGRHAATVKAFQKMLEEARGPMVIDADALNILSENRELLHLVPKQSILTPHPGEFKRLVEGWGNDLERLELVKKLSKDINAVIVLKGAYTSIASPDGQVYFNSTGNPGMATAGSGDVLTGILTALLASKMTSLDAALVGVYVHGLAGDLAAYDKGYTSLIASDIISSLPDAFKQINQ